MRVIPSFFCLLAALVAGLAFNSAVHAQDTGPGKKCCGYEYTNHATRESTDCAGNICTVMQCANPCYVCGSQYAISCSGTYITYVDSCYAFELLKCPCNFKNDFRC